MSESKQAWLSNPSEAHREWRQGLVVADRAYADQSQRLYVSLFGRFCRWLLTQQVTLLSMDYVDLARFLDTLVGRDGKVAANRTQRTYVAEVDRVMAHLVSIDLRQDNPARKLLETLRITTPLRPHSIRIPRSDVRGRYLELIASAPAQLTAAEVQSRAMNFLMLDGGLTLKELQKLLLKHADHIADCKVQAPGHRALMERTVPLTPEAKHWLLRWMDVRSTLKIITPAQYKAVQSAQHSGLQFEIAACPGERSGRNRMFVNFTGKSGKPLGLRSTGIVIDRVPESTIYLSAQEAMLAVRHLSEDERKAVKNKGPQALRTLFCAKLVEQGLPADEVANLMGLRGPDQVWAMTRAVKGRI